MAHGIFAIPDKLSMGFKLKPLLYQLYLFYLSKTNVQGTLPRKKKEPENIHVPKWVPETYSQSDSEDSEILIPEGPNHVHAAMSDSDSESPPETKSNSKKKSRSKSKSKVERQRSSTPKLPTPQKVSIAGVSGPVPKQFRPNSRVAELMSKFSYFQSESEETIKSSMKSKFQRLILRQDKSFMIFYQFKILDLTPNEQILISEVISNIRKSCFDALLQQISCPMHQIPTITVFNSINQTMVMKQLF